MAKKMTCNVSDKATAAPKRQLQTKACVSKQVAALSIHHRGRARRPDFSLSKRSKNQVSCWKKVGCKNQSAGAVAHKEKTSHRKKV
ncbi:hypothetical protein VTN00DRAFT_3886 [Thermoascus crustaceus]|uniref:uncharacterized protein n=1 Tax=Thermoascus crustaceus TaxID=5088 RepID=UPI003743757D